MNLFLASRCSIGASALCLSIGVTVSAAQDVQETVTSLEPGGSVERDLNGGQSHAFRVHLSSGQFLHVVVTQKGIDVELNLAGPDGKQIANVDSPNGSNGPEPVVVVAEAPGDYRLTVTSPNKKSRTGKYEIRIVALRPATPGDSDHVRAERAFEEAYRKLRPQRTASSRVQAIEKYGQALSYFEISGDRYRQALILNTIGIAYAESGDFRKALEYYNRALPLFQSVGDRLRECGTVISIGGVYDVLGDPQKALEYNERGRLMARDGADRLNEAIALSNIGKLYNDLADWQKGIGYSNQAVKLFRELGEPRREAITLNNLGLAYSGLGDYEKALSYHRLALPLRRATGDKRGEGQTLSNIGTVLAGLADYHSALEQYDQALQLRRAAGDRIGEAATLDNIGVVYGALREHQKALAYHEQALLLERAVEDRRGEGITLGNIGSEYASLGDPAKAIEYQGQALSLFRTVGDRQNEAMMLLGMARAERDRSHLIEARRLIEESLSKFEEVRARVEGQELRASYLASRQDAYEFYIDLLMGIHRREPTAGYSALALDVSERAHARSLLDMLADAQVDIRRGADPTLLERERDLVGRLNRIAQRLIEPATADESQALKRDITDLETEYQQVQANIRLRSSHYAGLTQPHTVGIREIQTQMLDEDTLLLEYSLGENRSYLWAITNSSVTGYELPGRGVIDNAVRRLRDLLTAEGSFNGFETRWQKRHRLSRTDLRLGRAAVDLSKIVLAPAANDLRKPRIVVVADGALHYVPFGMLPLPSSFRVRPGHEALQPLPVIARHEVISLPSASTFCLHRKELADREPAPKNLAVIADPVFSTADERVKPGPNSVVETKQQPEFSSYSTTRILEHITDGNPDRRIAVIPRLPYTRQEAERALAFSPAAANLKAIDFEASRSTVTAPELSKYRYVHFATHGYLNTENPGLSAIVLSLVDEHGNPQDGLLTANDIYNLNLPAELVVLSACQTGLGKGIKGEGLVGLTRGFMYAGAARVVVSLWNVNDKATSELMARFYRAMLKDNKRPAAALRAAQIEMWKQPQWKSPYYWAAFVLQGEWR